MHCDRTVYGASRTATTSFFTHHLRLISLAAVIGAALPRHLGVIRNMIRKSHLLSFPRGARLHDYWQQASKRGAAKECVCLAQSLTCAVPVDLYGLSVCRGSRTSVAVGVMICYSYSGSSLFRSSFFRMVVPPPGPIS